MKNKRRYVTASAIIVAVLLLMYGPYSYNRGKFETDIVWSDRQVSVDLVPIVDAVLKDNTLLREGTKALLESIEVRDFIIEDQAEQIKELRERPPEIVEKIVEVEKIVYVEVPAPTPEPLPVIEDDDDGDNDGPVIIPEPEPDPPCDWDRWHDGKHSHKDHKEGRHDNKKEKDKGHPGESHHPRTNDSDCDREDGTSTRVHRDR